MNFLNKVILILLFFFISTQKSFSEQTIRYANVDLIVQETKIGNLMLNKIKKIDQDNIEKLNSFEKEISLAENEIKMKKNIISEDEFNKEVNKLKSKISVFNEEKNLMVKKLNEIKKEQLKIFFDKINPIVQDYMNKNSIDMLLNSKNLFIGNKNLDLTKKLIEEINNKT